MERLTRIMVGICVPLQFDHDADQERLNEVYERMAQISGSTAEARASKILHGLGFTESMQKRQTQSFRYSARGLNTGPG